MKNLKKLLPLILMLALMPCLTLSASATTLPDDTVTAPLEVVFAQENSYLYWADDLGAGSPEIVYDCHTQQYYLRFQLTPPVSWPICWSPTPTRSGYGLTLIC